MNRNARRNPALLVARALELQRAGNLEEAEATLRAGLVKNPRLGDALHLLGLIRHDRGDLPDAIALISRAVEAMPANLDAWRNLGNLLVEAGDDTRAAACFRRVLEHRPADVAARGNLAMLLDRAGHPDWAIDELRELVRRAPAEVGALALLAKLLRRTKRHEEEVVVARELTRLRPDDAPYRRALSRSYFLWFDAVDRDPERARRVLDAWIAFDPDDPVARHMVAAHEGGEGVPPRASDGYVARHFDEFAETFDQVLGGLQYRGPELIGEALREADPTPRARHVVADLGCGTGACGPVVRPWARALTGVDLSRNMLDRARARGVYDDLVELEIGAFLAMHAASLDLIVCADVLTYVGDLGPLFACVARSLAPGGRFIATAEVDDETPTYRLQRAGRYAHRADYVTRSLEQAGLAVERATIADLRREFSSFVKSVVVTARARAAPP